MNVQRAPSRGSLLVRLVLATLLVAQLPFEVRHPLVVVGPIGITNLELAAYGLIGVSLIAVATRNATMPRVSWLVVVLAAVALVAGLLASATAVFDRSLSILTLGRLLSAGLAGIALASLLADLRRAGDRGRVGVQVLGAVALLSAVVSAGLGIVEWSVGWPGIGGLLTAFREDPVVLAGFATRASGSILHPNIAGWYWGSVATVALTVALRPSGARPVGSSRRTVLAGRGALVLAAVVLLLAAVLSLGRGALIATMVGAVTLAVVSLRRGALPRSRAAALLGVPLVVVLVGAVSSPVLAARLVSEDLASLQRASLDVPVRITVPDRLSTIPVTVTNLSPLTWRAHGPGSVQLAYRIAERPLEASFRTAVFTAFPHDLPPGASVTVPAYVDSQLVPSGATLLWGLVQDRWSWFELPESARVTTRAAGTVANPAPIVDPAPGTAVDGPAGPPPLSRRVLWSVAAQMIAERPLTGVGLDNFRIGYGPSLGLSDWDRRMNANQQYLELAAGMGIPGAAALVLLLALGLVGASRAVRSGRSGWPTVAAVVLLVSFAAHGMVDAYLFSSTAMFAVFALAAVGWVAAGDGARGSPPGTAE